MKKQMTYAILAISLILGSALVAFPIGIQSIAGLAVAQTSTKWNALKDIIVGDSQTNGVGLFSPCLWNGSSCDRARGDITNGLDVDVTRTPGGAQTPADAFANPTTFQGVWGLFGSFNGTTWDRIRSVSGANNTATTSLGALQTAQLSTWNTTHSPAAGVRATASRAAGGGTVRHVLTDLTICVHPLAAAAAGQISFTAQLRDGATSAGTVLRSWYFSAESGDKTVHIPCVDVTGLNIVGSANTAMTLEFVALVANVAQTVSFSGYSTP